MKYNLWLSYTLVKNQCTLIIMLQCSTCSGVVFPTNPLSPLIYLYFSPRTKLHVLQSHNLSLGSPLILNTNVASCSLLHSAMKGKCRILPTNVHCQCRILHNISELTYLIDAHLLVFKKNF